LNLTIFELPSAGLALRRCLDLRGGVDPRDMGKPRARFVIALATSPGSFCTAGADTGEEMLRVFEIIYRAAYSRGVTELLYDHYVQPATLHRLEAFARELQLRCAMKVKAAARLQ